MDNQLRQLASAQLLKSKTKKKQKEPLTISPNLGRAPVPLPSLLFLNEKKKRGKKKEPSFAEDECFSH